MKDKTKIDLISRLLMVLTFLGFYSTPILIFKIPNSPLLLILVPIALICAYFIVKFAVMKLVKIFLRIFEEELMVSLRADGSDEGLMNRIASAQKEIRINMLTIH